MPGLKRKRGGRQQDSESGDAALQRKVSGKLHHSFKEAVKAAKKAKAFEIRRAVKKLKEAREKQSDDVQSLEKKLEMVKELDHATLARVSLARKIQKIQALATHPMVQSALADAAVPSLDTIRNDAKHVLLSSKILAGEVDRLCTGLKDLVEPRTKQVQEATENEENEKAGDLGDDGDEEWKGVASDGDDSSNDSETSQPNPSVLQSALSKLGIELDGSQPASPPSSSSQDGDSVVLEGDEKDEENLDDQASWESGSVDSEGNIRRAVSVSSASSGSSSPPAKRVRAIAESKASAGAGSRFLPSLASGFIRGDSDASDIEDADVAPERKNRRGQRARKAIWEKKYGKNANHVKKAREEAMATRGRGRGRGGFRAGTGRGGASAAGRGAGSSDTRGGHANALRGRGGRIRPPPAELPTTKDGGWGQRAAKKAEEKPMHPSWIAKQKLKAKEALGGVPAQGKKIVFN